jgi:Rod binding domain-containing protein
MISGLNLTHTSLATTTAPAKDTPEAIRNATEQFEALLIAQMLRHARESGGGWMGEGDQAGGHMMGLAEEQLAQVLAARGGLGLAQLTAASVASESGRGLSTPQPAEDFGPVPESANHSDPERSR